MIPFYLFPRNSILQSGERRKRHEKESTNLIVLAGQLAPNTSMDPNAEKAGVNVIFEEGFMKEPGIQEEL